MEERSAELTGRGIEPRLIPAARNLGSQVMATIRQLPITIREATDKVVGVIGCDFSESFPQLTGTFSETIPHLF
jgi:hypothetical protein